MAVVSEFDAKMNLRAFIERLGHPHSDWCVGTAADPRDRLVNHHGLDETSGVFLAETLESAEAAGRVEKSLVDAGCNGGVGDGSGDAATGVYVYLKGTDTNP